MDAITEVLAVERAWTEAHLYGDFAVLEQIMADDYLRNGEAFDYAARFLTIYVKHGGRWQMVAEQFTPIV